LTTENENGELRQLLEIKRAYRKDLASFEEELKARYERELADGKKGLKERYLENLVDVVFAEQVPAPSVEQQAPVAEPAPPPVLAEVKPACPECGSSISPTDKFCSQCAFPLRDESETVGTAGRTRRTRVSGTSASARRTRLARSL
jgi:hypothetical protein